MKLITFDSETLQPQRLNKSVPKVSFGKTGIISFNKAASEKMGLTDGCKVSFAQDESQPENWYFFLDTKGYPVRRNTTSKSTNYIFNHQKLAHTFKDAIGVSTGNTYSFIIGGQPTVLKGVKYWGLLIPNN